MIVSISSFTTNNVANKPEENLDRFRFVVTPSEAILAVSDGATESPFPEWATLLTIGFTEKLPSTCWTRRKNRRAANFFEWIKPLQKECIAQIVSRELQFWEAVKLQDGVFATFIGLHIDCEKQSWRACAIGDSNLFLIRKRRIAFSWPMKSAESFDSEPDLVFTKWDNNDPERFKTIRQRKLKNGDEFWLATDALSAHILQVGFRDLANVSSHAQFRSYINFHRDVDLKNDDLTLVKIKVKEM